LFRYDAPLQLRLSAIPSLAGWGLSFLYNSRVIAYEHNTLTNLKLALYSLQVMEVLRRAASGTFGGRSVDSIGDAQLHVEFIRRRAGLGNAFKR
jgi:hypothetical protein